MRPIRVVHIITKLELGGAQQNTLFTVEHLDRGRFEPHLITNEEGILVPEAVNLEGVKTYLLPELIREINPVMDVRALFRIQRILRKLKKGNHSPLIVHTHSSKAGIVGRWAARLAAADIIIHSIHGFGFHDFQPAIARRLFVLLEKATARITDAFIAVSEANITKGVNCGIFPRDKAVLIRSGIQLEQFRNPRDATGDGKRKLNIDPAVPLVTMIGCLKPQKAPLDYLEVAHAVLEKKDANFILVGDGMLRDDVQKKAESLKLGTRFRLLGWRRDIPHILAATDIFVLTSLWEGLPRVLAEAMVIGIPIVATKVDGTPEAVVEGVNGFLVEPKDTRAMAEKVLYLLNNPGEAKELGEKGSTMVEEFDIWRMVKKQENLYQRLLESKGRQTV